MNYSRQVPGCAPIGMICTVWQMFLGSSISGKTTPILDKCNGQALLLRIPSCYSNWFEHFSRHNGRSFSITTSCHLSYECSR